MQHRVFVGGKTVISSNGWLVDRFDHGNGDEPIRNGQIVGCLIDKTRVPKEARVGGKRDRSVLVVHDLTIDRLQNRKQVKWLALGVSVAFVVVVLVLGDSLFASAPSGSAGVMIDADAILQQDFERMDTSVEFD